MPYVNGIIACILLVFAGVQFSDPGDALLLASLLGGALLAFLSMQRNIGLIRARALAVLTTGAMFFYFASFFKYCPAMTADWYMQERAADVIGLLFAGFAMIPVLSVYSCWMKAECHMHKYGKVAEQAVAHVREHHAS